MIPRNLRVATPAKLLLVLFAVVFYFSFPFSSSTHFTTVSDLKNREKLANAPLSELVSIYEEIRTGHLEQRGFNGTAQATKLRSPLTLPDGTSTFDPSLNAYVSRLRSFVDEYLRFAPSHIRTGARNAIKDVLRRLPPHSRAADFPAKVWSTHPFGIEGVEEGFHLWRKILPLPLSSSLMDEGLLPSDAAYLGPARKGQSWDVVVTDDDGLDRWMSEWTAEKISRGIRGEGKWASLWGRLDKGVLRADLFRYMSMFAEGGIYSDSDTMPISHPYLWGLNAPSTLHPDLQHIISLISAALPDQAVTKDRLNPRQLPEDIQVTQHRYTHSNASRHYDPPYASLSRRAPITPIDPITIAQPNISIIVAIEWDSCIGRNWRMISLWSLFRIRRSWRDCCYPRGLQMVQNLLVSKPFHPIMLDTLATIARLVEHGGLATLSPLELTGPGPFTDAVLRYMLVQYGVTSEDLRCLRGPVRVGDVIVLQEEAFHAPQKAMTKLLGHIQSLGTDLSRAKHKYGPWRFGLGWSSWNSGGIKVAYHGLTGIWKKG